MQVTIGGWTGPLPDASSGAFSELHGELGLVTLVRVCEPHVWRNRPRNTSIKPVFF